MREARGVVGLLLMVATVVSGGDPVPHVSGGVGSGEREELQRVRGEHSLHLIFARTGDNAFVTNVRVVIERDDEAVLDTVTDGPWLLVKLPRGSYLVKATFEGQTQSAKIEISGEETLQKAFYWSSP